MHILLLGGTTEASQLARHLATTGWRATFSYAGRTNAPVTQPLPQRIGGFGGVEGLQAYLTTEAVTHVIDATHPFAEQMSRHAHLAASALRVPLLRLERPAWSAEPADRWRHVPRIEDAPAALPDGPAGIFLAIGKQHLALFAAKPQHHYLLRLVDPPEVPPPLPHHTVVLARGPFDVPGDMALMRDHGISHVVAKNAGGIGAVAKLEAARALDIEVILIDRPALPAVETASDTAQVMRWLTHSADRGV